MSSFYQLEFEKPLIEIERRIDSLEERLKRLHAPVATPAPGAGEEPAPTPFPFVPEAIDEVSDEPADPEQISQQIEQLRQEHRSTLARVYSHMSAWDTVRVSRHPKRPQTRDYIDLICKDFCELHGDRRFGDDPAMVTGFARIGSIKCLLVGHQKGRTTQEKIACHFGCAHPEGYRKALAKMVLAEKWELPIVTLVDTPGAYPGVGAEQRGQAEAIAVNLREMSRLKTPIVSIIIGEGGSGGALGIAVADQVAMLQHSWYSVISPEGCAAILWKQANEQTNSAAAESLKLTAGDNLELQIIDDIIPEPLGGAHRDPKATASAVERWIIDHLQELKRHKPASLPARRYERFRKLGAILETTQPPVVLDPETEAPAATG
jgi:acetyl-CoA carboxylase carboxyl transferase subunit alpha